MNILRSILCLLTLAVSVGAQTTQPATQPARPDVQRIVGWTNNGAQSLTPLRNVSYINPAPQGYLGSPVEQQLTAFADAGWKRAAVRCPFGTTPTAANPIGVIAFTQELDAKAQGFGFIATSYRQMWARIHSAHPDVEEIDYLGSPETAVTPASLLHRTSLDPLATRVIKSCPGSIAFDASSGAGWTSFTQRVLERCDLTGHKAYVEAVPGSNCPWLWARPFFIQESFDETVEAQQASGHQADWAATRAQLGGERICILDQPPPGADWNVPANATQATPWTGDSHDAWLAAVNKILARGDTAAVPVGVVLALWPGK